MHSTIIIRTYLLITKFCPRRKSASPTSPAGCSAVGRSRRTGGRPSAPRCHALELVRVATRATRGPTPRTDAGFERTRERGRADPRGERAREREERLNFGGGARQAGLAGLAGDARDARGYHYDRKKVHHGCLRYMCPQYCPKFSLLLLLLLQEAVEPSPIARRTTGVQAEARRSGEAGEADRGQLRAEPRLVRNHHGGSPSSGLPTDDLRRDCAAQGAPHCVEEAQAGRDAKPNRLAARLPLGGSCGERTGRANAGRIDAGQRCVHQ
jgi:hypothetical protein